jgi:hypothetical protein
MAETAAAMADMAAMAIAAIAAISMPTMMTNKPPGAQLAKGNLAADRLRRPHRGHAALDIH